MAGEKGPKPVNENTERLSEDEIAEIKEGLLEKKGQLVSEGYKELFRAHLAYQYGATKGLPEYEEISRMEKHLKARGTFSPAEIEDRVARKKFDIYRSVTAALFRYERDLDPAEAKRIREKIIEEFKPA